MGKGEIISEIGNGGYSVKIIYGYRAKVNNRIANMENQIVILNQKIAEMEEGLQKDVMELQVKSLEKQIEYLGIAMPADPTRNLWCSDFTTGLSGEVGLIEICEPSSGTGGGNTGLVMFEHPGVPKTPDQ